MRIALGVNGRWGLVLLLSRHDLDVLESLRLNFQRDHQKNDSKEHQGMILGVFEISRTLAL